MKTQIIFEKPNEEGRVSSKGLDVELKKVLFFSLLENKFINQI